RLRPAVFFPAGMDEIRADRIRPGTRRRGTRPVRATDRRYLAPGRAQPAMTSSSRIPRLEGSRVHLRAMRRGEIPALFALHADPMGMRYGSFPPLTRIEQAQELFDANARGARTGECVTWVIALNADDAMIGTCTLFAIDARHRRAMIGYAL